MRRALTPAILTVSLAIALVSGAEDDRTTKLNRGDVLVDTRPLAGSDVPEVILDAVVDAPPERVWPLLDRCGDYAKTMVRMKDTKELSRVGDIVRCESVVEMPWPLSNLHGILVAQHTAGPPKWVRDWKMESGDFKRNEGSWTLTAWPGGKTLIEYRMRSEPNIPIPQFIQGMATRAALPDMIVKLRSLLKG